MKIKTENGEMNVTSQGQGSLNTVLGAVGTAGALGMMNGLFGRRPRLERNLPISFTEYTVIS